VEKRKQSRGEKGEGETPRSDQGPTFEGWSHTTHKTIKKTFGQGDGFYNGDRRKAVRGNTKKTINLNKGYAVPLRRRGAQPIEKSEDRRPQLGAETALEAWPVGQDNQTEHPGHNMKMKPSKKREAERGELPNRAASRNAKSNLTMRILEATKRRS